MQFEELRYVCLEAAVELAGRGRPVRPALVLPAPDKTRLLTLTDFPDDAEARHDYLATVVETEIVPSKLPAWGFVSEGEIDGEAALVVVFGARRNAPHVTASRFGEDGEVVEFAASEELDPTALPFLHPLQHGVDSLPAIEQAPGPMGDTGLPMFGSS